MMRRKNGRKTHSPGRGNHRSRRRYSRCSTPPPGSEVCQEGCCCPAAVGPGLPAGRGRCPGQQQQMAPPPPQYAAPAPQAPAQSDLTAKLNELAQLHNSGVLTDEEFSAAKAKLLAG